MEAHRILSTTGMCSWNLCLSAEAAQKLHIGGMRPKKLDFGKIYTICAAFSSV